MRVLVPGGCGSIGSHTSVTPAESCADPGLLTQSLKWDARHGAQRNFEHAWRWQVTYASRYA